MDGFLEEVKKIGVKNCEDIHRMQLSAIMLSGVVAPLQHTGVPTEHFGSVVWGSGVASVMATLTRRRTQGCMFKV